MELIIEKVIALSIVLVSSMIFSWLPYFLVQGSCLSVRSRSRVIAVLNCFGGGVFLGTLLLHLMIEGSEDFEEYKTKSGWDTKYPFFHLFSAVGFFAVAALESGVSYYWHNKTSRDTSHSAENHNHNCHGHYGAVVMPRNKQEVMSQKRHSADDISHHNRMHDGHNEADSLLHEENFNSPNTVVTQVEDGSVTVSAVLAVMPSGLRAFLLMFALSFHTIFDGLAISLQSEASEMWQVFSAIIVHKSIVGFCLGLEMFKFYLQAPYKAFCWGAFFSLMCPFGMFIGIVVTSGEVNETAELLSSSILQGIAVGTFLYVTFLEILSVYIGHNSEKKFGHILCVFIGFSVMAGMKLVSDD